MLSRPVAFTKWANCFHSHNTMSDSCFQHPLLLCCSLYLPLALVSMQSSERCVASYDLMDTEKFSHSSVAQQKLFVIQHWSLRQQEGEANQNNSSSQSFQDHWHKGIDRKWCVRQFDQRFISYGQTGRHPQGGRGESFRQGVEGRWIWMEIMTFIWLISHIKNKTSFTSETWLRQH